MTIREYINTLPEPIRSRALANERYKFSDIGWDYERPGFFINAAFRWNKTNEGWDFWLLVEKEKFDEAITLLNPTQDLGERIATALPDYLSDYERVRIMLEIMDAIKDHLK